MFKDLQHMGRRPVLVLSDVVSVQEAIVHSTFQLLSQQLVLISHSFVVHVIVTMHVAAL